MTDADRERQIGEAMRDMFARLNDLADIEAKTEVLLRLERWFAMFEPSGLSESEARQ
jgi:hypothetical protein